MEEEIDAEVAFHLRTETERLIARGMSEPAARDETLRRFGDVQRTRAALARISREGRMHRRRVNWLTDLMQDLRYAGRGLRRQPGFAALVIITLGLGIGANATMFGIIDRILLRPPAFLHQPADAGRIYLRRPNGEGGERVDNNISYRRFTDLRDGARSLATIAAFYNDDRRVIGTGERARQAAVSLVSGTFFSMFEVRPAVGRFFAEAEDRLPSGTAVAVLGFNYWQSEFGGDAGAVGRTMLIGPRAYTIVGVAPKGFTGMSMGQVAAFIPLTAGGYDDFGDYYHNSGYNLSWLEVVARKKPELSREAANLDLTLAFQRGRTTEPSIRPEVIERSRAELAPVLVDRGPEPGESARVAEWLAGVSAVVLLIATANVANLFLARALKRRREIAVRLALGVGRRRLLRQLLTESMVLALLGGATGLFMAHFGGGVLRRVLLAEVDWSATPLFDGRILAFTAAIALLTGLLTGLAPAWHAGGTSLTAALRSGGREGSRPRARLRTTLLVVQAALSVVLLSGAGLFVKSLRNAQGVDLGYNHGRLVVVLTDLRGERLAPDGRPELTRRLLEQARAMPGVEQVTQSFGIPFWRSNTIDLFVPGRDSLNGLGAFYQNVVGADYFETLGTTIVRGRGITREDRNGPARVAVVSERLAKAVWPGANAVGQCVKIGADSMPCSEVIGVARDVRWGSLGDDDRMQIYEPMSLQDSGVLFVRAAGDPALLAEPLRRELQRLMPGAAFVNVRQVAVALDPVLRPWRLGATMFTLFGTLALLVAAVGLYGVIAYSVAQRTHEVGVRMALGARRADVVRLVLGEGIRVAVAGVVLGTLAAIAVGRFAASMLFGISPYDVTTLAQVGIVLLAVAGVASLVPAWRAARVDPNAALRAD